MKKTVAFCTLGCKVNQYETDAMRGSFEAEGYEVKEFSQEASVYVINTCTVTNMADRKSRQMMHRAKKKNPDGIIVAVGCYVQAAKEQLEEDTLIDLVIGNNMKSQVVQIVEQYIQDNRHTEDRDAYVADIAHSHEYETMHIETVSEHTRAYIKIQDGCNQFCTYCIIPFARGRVRSRELPDVLQEIRTLAKSGYREVVLSAISLPSYGLDTGTNLVELVEHCAQVEGIQRIRLGSLDPDMLTPEFITRLAAVEKLCPQFHLSLQSGCTATLRRMRRVYTAEQYAQVVDQLRAAYGERPVSFTTDCICGFPGETQADFEESCEFLKKIGFLKVHVFPYSRRSGTPAYDFPEQVHEREKQERSRVMNGIAEEVRREVLAAYVGTEDDVLLETPLSGTLFTGYTRLYIPVVVSAPGHESGQIVHVTLGEYDGERVRAALC